MPCNYCHKYRGKLQRFKRTLRYEVVEFNENIYCYVLTIDKKHFLYVLNSFCIYTVKIYLESNFGKTE